MVYSHQPLSHKEFKELTRMLYLSTTPNNASLLNLARQLLQFIPPKIQEAVELTKMVQAEKSSWNTRVREVNMLLGNNRTKQARGPIVEPDAAEYFQEAASAWQAKFLRNVIIRSGNPEETLHLLEKHTNRLEESAQINLRITIAGRLLTENFIPEATALISELDYEKNLRFIKSPQNKIRLIFLKDILSKEKQLNFSRTQEALYEIISSANQPLVENALAENIRILMGRMEGPNVTLLDRKASQWIAEALLIEYRVFPISQKHLKCLARWMVFAGRVTEIVNITEKIYRADPSISDNYTYLSIFLWKKGYYKEGLSCFQQERLNDTIDPFLIFTRTLSFSIFSKPESTAYWLNKLYYIDDKFFTRPNINTHWGFLVLILKKLGQDILSYKAQAMAKKKDPYNATRQHLWSKIPLSPCMIQFPSFIMPDEFNNIDKE